MKFPSGEDALQNADTTDVVSAIWRSNIGKRKLLDIWTKINRHVTYCCRSSRLLYNVQFRRRMQASVIRHWQRNRCFNCPAAIRYDRSRAKNASLVAISDCSYVTVQGQRIVTVIWTSTGADVTVTRNTCIVGLPILIDQVSAQALLLRHSSQQTTCAPPTAAGQNVVNLQPSLKKTRLFTYCKTFSNC